MFAGLLEALSKRRPLFEERPNRFKDAKRTDYNRRKSRRKRRSWGAVYVECTPGSNQNRKKRSMQAGRFTGRDSPVPPFAPFTGRSPAAASRTTRGGSPGCPRSGCAGRRLPPCRPTFAFIHGNKTYSRENRGRSVKGATKHVRPGQPSSRRRGGNSKWRGQGNLPPFPDSKDGSLKDGGFLLGTEV